MLSFLGGKDILFEKFSQFFRVYIPLYLGNRGFIIRATGTIKFLWRDGDQVDQLFDDFMQLDVDANILEQKHDIQKIDKGESLHYYILSLKKWKREKQKWYTSEYIEQIRCLIRKYHDNHQTIIKELQISNSTFYRLMKTPNNPKTIEYDRRRNTRDSAKLTELEQAYVKVLVKPTSEPIKVDNIQFKTERKFWQNPFEMDKD